MQKNTEERILYYLGAGASAGPSASDGAQALPIAKSVARLELNGTITGLPHALRILANTLKRQLENHSYPEPFFSAMLSDFHELANQGEAFGNVDTYAKLLNIKGEIERLNKLKRTLSLFFAIEQNWNGKLDKRYKNWLISIMDIAMFPQNIKILSWNYDFQVQLAAREYEKESFTTLDGKFIRHLPFIKYYPEIDPGRTAISDVHSLK